MVLCGEFYLTFNYVNIRKIVEVKVNTFTEIPHLRGGY